MNKIFKLIFITLLLFSAHEASAATKYWVGGGSSTNWNATGNTNWSDTDGGANNATVPAAGDDVVMKSAADCVVNVATANLKSFDMTGYTGTLSGTNQITVIGSAGTTQNVIFAGTISWTGTLLFNGSLTSTIGLTTNGKALTSINMSGSQPTILNDNLTFAAVKTATLIINAVNSPTLDMNGKTISGDSSINRVLIHTSTLGTSRTITVNGGTFANADFRDILFNNGGSNLDLSAITGLSGNAGGNGMSGGGTLTLTTAATQNWTNTSGGNWSDSGNWSGRVPLPQDDVTFNTVFTTNRTVTADMPRLGKSIDWSSATFTTSLTWSLASTPNTIYGSVTLLSTSGFSTSGTQVSALEGRGTFTFTSAGKTWSAPITISMVGGTLTLQDAFTGGVSIALNNGTFNANNFNVTGTRFDSAVSSARTINMGSGTWTFTQTSGTPWNLGTVTNLTFNANTSTIVISATNATSKTFAGGGLTYSTATITGSNITFTGSNTFTTLNLTNPGLIGTKFTQSTNTTATNWNISGSVGSLVSASSTSATNATWTKAGGGTVCASYIHITDITGSPASTFYAENSTDGGDNTNWTFTACPAAGGNNNDGDWFLFTE